MKRKIMSLYILMSVFLFLSSFSSFAQEKYSKEILFLLDASGSMKTNDPNRLAIDSIAQFIYSLPTNYQVGFVSYNTQVNKIQAPLDNKGRDEIMALAESVKYADYSNAGDGLLQAVNLLITSEAKEKTIVLLSDGEILMRDAGLTEQSIISYKTAIEQAALNGITIHVIGLSNDMENQDNYIFQAATQTSGAAYYTPQAIGIQNAIDSILNDQLRVKQTTVAIVDTDGGVETLSIDLPFAHASKVRILLTSNSMIENLNTNFQADSANQIKGERYSLIEMSYPKSDRIDLSFSGAAGSRIRITVIPEYQVVPKVEVKYTDRISDAVDSFYYNREASISFKFYDTNNSNIQLWTEDYFDHGNIPVRIGEITDNTAIKNGEIFIHMPIAEEKTEEILLDYDELAINVLGTDKISVDLDPPPVLIIEEPKPDPPYALIIMGVLAVFGISVFIWFLSRPKPQPLPPEDKPEPGKYSYVGKLNIYITRSPSGYDIPPLSYNLFRLPTTKVISLGEVLESCEVKERFEGADRIYFKSGSGRSIILTNNSDCTIMKNREILMKKKSYQLFVESKVDITFEDEISELTFQYKDLKPSEMW